MKKPKITKKNKAELQAEFIDFLVKDLFHAVTTEHFLISRGPNMYLGGQLLNSGDKMELISGAQTLKQLMVWQVLMKEMKGVAGRRIIEESKTIEDIVFGKAMLYALDVLEKKIENLANLR